MAKKRITPIEKSNCKDYKTAKMIAKWWKASDEDLVPECIRKNNVGLTYYWRPGTMRWRTIKRFDWYLYSEPKKYE